MNSISQTKIITTNIGYALCLHFDSFPSIDEIIRQSIYRAYEKYSCYWLMGSEWLSDSPIDKDHFNEYFRKELEEYSKYRKGINTRVIGTLIINDLQALAFFRKIHDEYTVVLYNSRDFQHEDYEQLERAWSQQSESVSKLSEFLFSDAPSEFKHNLFGPPTLFYIINKTKGIVSADDVENNLTNSGSEFYSFIKRFFCAKGVHPERLPRGTVNNEFVLIRHPSYYYSEKLNEKFMLIPIRPELHLPARMRVIDIVAAVEHYHSRFYAYLKAAGVILESVGEQTRFLSQILREKDFSSMSLRQIKVEFIGITKNYRELIDNYLSATALQEELDHTYDDVSHLVSGLVQESSYSTDKERRINRNIEGPVESIMLEFKMRHTKALRMISASISRSYTSFKTLSEEISSLYQIAIANTMLGYTVQIKYLTIVLVIFGIVAIAPYLTNGMRFILSLLK